MKFNAYTIELRGNRFHIACDCGGWEERDRYTARLVEYSVNPDICGEGYNEMLKEVERLAALGRRKDKQPPLDPSGRAKKKRVYKEKDE